MEVLSKEPVPGSNAFLAASALFSTVIAGPTDLNRRATTISNAKTPPVSVKGNAFFTSKGRFYIRGVDYQPGGASAAADPIADTSGCERDVAKFKELGINTIRVYTVDNSADHDACMKTLADAGIYLALDVNTPYYSLNRLDEPSIQRSYNEVYLQSVFATVDAFAKYDNTLLFYSANEVINNHNTTFAAPYVKAVTRDIRAYIKARGYRSIPVGYSAADVEENRYEMAQYMNCGSDDVRSDFYAFNDYSWCDPSSYTISGWDKKVVQYKDYGLPLFLSEYGCNTNTRKFAEVAALYGSQMTPVYSGGLVYEYSQEDSNYGLVEISGDTVTERDDFTALKSALSNTSPPSGDGGYKSSGSASQCPAASDKWAVTTTDLPTMPSKAEQYLKEGAGAGPGNKGTTGSQNAGTPSTGFSSGGSSNSTGSGSTKKSAAVSVKLSGLTFAAGLMAVSAILL
ncbi:glycoside hydrolase family 72 protein [Trichodelitschia bisporula]|uniref:1,3-beta-glucanosyltransferase n=1 Tax=Trichodelitschia bisporula TaxID=703511 RepID=A0A6G1HP44_9PEZI|nr:glycoside hydrolase family 72 protein [Trichodelitschia bisporula]